AVGAPDILLIEQRGGGVVATLIDECCELPLMPIERASAGGHKPDERQKQRQGRRETRATEVATGDSGRRTDVRWAGVPDSPSATSVLPGRDFRKHKSKAPRSREERSVSETE